MFPLLLAVLNRNILGERGGVFPYKGLLVEAGTSQGLAGLEVV